MDSFKFNCPHCGRHIEAEANMVGLVFDCPVCGRPFKVPKAGDGHHEAAQCRTPNRIAIGPSGVPKTAHSARPIVVTVIRKRERFVDRCKEWLKRVVIGASIGVSTLLLFAGIAVGLGAMQTQREQSDKLKADAASVASSIEGLLSYIKLPTDRRLRSLSDSLESCPEDFQEAVRGLLSSVAKINDGTITASEKQEMAKVTLLFGLLFGAANQNDPQSSMATGLQLGSWLCSKAEEEAKGRLKDEIQSKVIHLIDVAQKYGVDPNYLENALLCR